MQRLIVIKSVPPCLHVSPTFPTGPTPTWSHKNHPIKTSFAGKVGSHVAVLRGVPGPSFRFRSSAKAPNIRKALCFGTQVFQDSLDLTEICLVISLRCKKLIVSNYCIVHTMTMIDLFHSVWMGFGMFLLGFSLLYLELNTKIPTTDK